MRTPTVRAVAIIAALATSARVGAQAADRFAACSRGGVLTPQGIGPLRIGLTPDSLKKVCRVLSEHGIREYDMTQYRVPVGNDTLLVHEQMGRIFWIEITSKAFRTADSIGVESPLGRVLDLEGLDGGFGDGTDAYALHATKGPNCGLVFWIDGVTATALSELPRDPSASGNRPPTGPVLAELRRHARTGSITSIDVRGCTSHGRGLGWDTQGGEKASAAGRSSRGPSAPR